VVRDDGSRQVIAALCPAIGHLALFRGVGGLLLFRPLLRPVGSEVGGEANRFFGVDWIRSIRQVMLAFGSLLDESSKALKKKLGVLAVA
jgi:hypothetical protein